MNPTTAVIIASGFSSRMGCNKLLLPFRGKSILQHCIDLVEKMNFTQSIIVTTPSVLKEVTVTMRTMLNPCPEKGQSVSVQLGATESQNGNSLIFFTGDQPLLDRQIVERILAEDDGKSIVFPVDELGDPTTPVLFASCFRNSLMSVKGDSGGKSVRTANSKACREIVMPEPYKLCDIDTPEDYSCLQRYDYKQKQGI